MKTCAFLFIAFSACLLYAHPPVGPYQSPGTHAHVGPTNLLIIYNTNWTDENTDGTNDSQDVAIYYAARRSVPTQNILGVSVTEYEDTTWKDYIAYDHFYSNVLIPVVHKLNSTNNATSAPFRNSIYYICPVYGIPPDVNTFFSNVENPFEYSWKNNRRSLDAFLTNPYLMYDNGLYFTNGNNRPGTAPYLPLEYGDMWGDWYYEIGLGNLITPSSNEWNKYYYKTYNPSNAQHFKQLRDAEAPDFLVNSYGYFLVTRIDAPTKICAMGLIDKSLYAEKYIHNFAGSQEHNYYAKLYADDDSYDSGFIPPLVFSHAIGGDIKNWFRGDSIGNAEKSVFDSSVAHSLAPWDWIADSYRREIGQIPFNHLPRIDDIFINQIQGFTASVFLAENTTQKYATNDFLYYVAGTILRGFEGTNITSSSGGIAAIVDVGTNDARLAWGDIVLSTTNNFHPGDSLSYIYSDDAFPYDDAMWYSAYYRHSTYPDIFMWPPGAVAIHNESYPCREFRHGADSPYFAGRALLRGLTAIPGAVEEPFADGIPFAHNFFRAFAQGFDYAEACYSATPCSIAWMNTFIGDPLYNPFLNLYADSNRWDTVAPAFTATNSISPLTIEVTLTSETEDNANDLAQFTLFYGTNTNTWAYTETFTEWPSPTSSSWNASRRYNWYRTYKWQVSSYPDKAYYQIIARDPYGNTTTGAVQQIVIPEPTSIAVVLCLACWRIRKT